MTEYQYPFQPEPPPAPEPTRRRWLVPALAVAGGAAVVALAVVTTLLVTSDDSSPPAAAPSATTHTVHPVPVPPSHTTPAANDPSLFHQFMTKEGFTAYASLGDLDSLAESVCVGFDAGLTMPMILDAVGAMNWGATKDGRFVGFAVASHCPEHNGDVQ